MKENKQYFIQTQEGSRDLGARVSFIGDDLLVAIWGGEKPHIGAVAIGEPRPSLKDPEITSSTASVYCCLGHKEDGIAKKAAEALSARLNTRVVVTAGIHWDNLDQAGILKVVENSQILLDMISDRLLQA